MIFSQQHRGVKRQHFDVSEPGSRKKADSLANFKLKGFVRVGKGKNEVSPLAERTTFTKRL